MSRRFFVIFILFDLLSLFIIPLILPQPNTANFISSSATLSNSKFSSENSIESGTMTISFTTVNEIPSNGNILVTIPAIQTADKACDGSPDTNTSVANNGFDLKNIDSSTISIVGCTDSNWNETKTVSCGTGSINHTILINRQNSSCLAGSTITITVKNIINPLPTNSNHLTGKADIYDINLKSRDNSNNAIDKIDLKIAPIEGVSVSAQVDETLSFSVEGVTFDSGSYCGITRDSSSPDTTSTSITWGTLSPIYNKSTHNTSQKLIVSTNAGSGYKVFIEESDQLGRDRNICTGVIPSSGQFMYGNSVCIRDTLCGSKKCNHIIAEDWIDMNNYLGFGYSLANQNGTNAKFLYNDFGREFSTRILADQESAVSPFDNNAEIMSHNGPVENSSIYVCYRITIPENQPAGNYSNKIIYTAIPTF